METFLLSKTLHKLPYPNTKIHQVWGSCHVWVWGDIASCPPERTPPPPKATAKSSSPSSRSACAICPAPELPDPARGTWVQGGTVCTGDHVCVCVCWMLTFDCLYIFIYTYMHTYACIFVLLYANMNNSIPEHPLEAVLWCNMLYVIMVHRVLKNLNLEHILNEKVCLGDGCRISGARGKGGRPRSNLELPLSAASR